MTPSNRNTLASPAEAIERLQSLNPAIYFIIGLVIGLCVINWLWEHWILIGQPARVPAWAVKIYHQYASRHDGAIRGYTMRQNMTKSLAGNISFRVPYLAERLVLPAVISGLIWGYEVGKFAHFDPLRWAITALVLGVFVIIEVYSYVTVIIPGLMRKS